jgi:phosphatidylglycerophosphate synthase
MTTTGVAPPALSSHRPITAEKSAGRIRRRARHVPFALTTLRVVLAPLIVALAWWWPNPAAFVASLTAAFLSDVFDGVIARRLGIATPALRRYDSAADTFFYGACVIAAWHLHRDVLVAHRVGLVVLLALELTRHVVDFARFRREASYHLWTSKAWGLALFVGFVDLLAFGADGWPVACAIAFGIVADVEGLAVSLTLRQWKNDVPTWFHARRLREAESAVIASG